MKADGMLRRLLATPAPDDAGRHFDTTAVSAICTAAFTLYHAFLGLWHASVWHGSICTFYALLTAVRGNILLSERRVRTQPHMQRARRRRTARVNALLLVALDALMLPPVAMLVLLARPVRTGRIGAIALAAYTCWKVASAIVHARRQQRNACADILTGQLGGVHIIDALFGILTLQNVLITVNRQGAAANPILPVSAASSAVIYAAIVAITVCMLYRACRRA